MEPIFLEAVCKDYIWGGNQLRERFGKKSTADRIAESWELACHKDGSSRILNGPDAGKTLTEYLSQHGTACLGTNCREFDTMPVLIKLIDAKENLSVQVHPDNAYAQRVEGEPGKTEMWYIVDCEPGASLLYGFQHAITKEEFKTRIAENTLLEVTNAVPVHKGDVFFIPSGTLHAIGKGILIAEIQQNSNTTYRVYDYGRIGADGKPRALHVEKALDVTTLTPLPPTVQYPEQSIPGGTIRKLAACPYFDTAVLQVETAVTQTVSAESFQHLLVTEGNAVLETASGSDPLPMGSSVLLPAGLGTYQIKGACTCIVTKVNAE